MLDGNSQPLAELPSQLEYPELHVPIEHAPSEHEAEAFAYEQTFPQEPQFDVLVSVLVSQPFTALPSQLPKPPEQTGWQALAEQLVVPWTFVHAVPQAPQFAPLFVRFVSQPFCALPSQLPNPPLHTG